MSVNISVKLFAQYRKGRFVSRKETVPEGATVADVVNRIGLDVETFPLGVVLVNGRHRDGTYVLQDGDELALFPKVGGG